MQHTHQGPVLRPTDRPTNLTVDCSAKGPHCRARAVSNPALESQLALPSSSPVTMMDQKYDGGPPK